MSSKTREAGFLLCDNRMSGGGLHEMATRRCAHCQAQVIMSPTRQRPRNWCRRCDEYVCDRADCILFCTPVSQQTDMFLDGVAKGLLILPNPTNRR
jgi:hypothetical protein